LASDHDFIVKRVHKHLTFRIADANGGFVSFVIRCTFEHDTGPPLTCILHLHQGRPNRHHDRCHNAKLGRLRGNTLRMIASARGNHAACTFFSSEP
jgi:hypothetical protein